MLQYFKSFFSYSFKTYTYNQSKEMVIKKINEILNKKTTFLDVRDIEGYFTSTNTFTIKLISPYSKSILYDSTLLAEVKEQGDNLIQIKTKVRPNLTLFFIFFLTPLLGGVYFYEFLRTSSLEFLFGSLGTMLAGPLFSVFLASIANTAIYERFDRFFDNELKK